MVGAVLRPETASDVDPRATEDGIEGGRIVGQRAARESPHDFLLDLRVRDRPARPVTVSPELRIADAVLDVGAGAVEIGGVDVEIRRAPEVAEEETHQRAILGTTTPRPRHGTAIVNRGCGPIDRRHVGGIEDGSAVIEDARAPRLQPRAGPGMRFGEYDVDVLLSLHREERGGGGGRGGSRRTGLAACRYDHRSGGGQG